MARRETKLNILELPAAHDYFLSHVRHIFYEVETDFKEIERVLTAYNHPVLERQMLERADRQTLPRLAIIISLLNSNQYGYINLSDELCDKPDETRDQWQVKEAFATRIIGYWKLYKTLLNRVGDKLYSPKRERNEEAHMWEDSDLEVRRKHAQWLFLTVATYFLFTSMDEVRDQILYGKQPGEEWWDIEGRDYP